MPDDAETANPPQKGRSLAGFYIAVGVVAALFLVGVWAWTPMKIAYWEWQVRRGGDGPITPGQQEALDVLFQMGPRAQPALERLLRSPYRNVPWVIANALYQRVDRQDFPLIVKAAQCQDPDVADLATHAAEKVLHWEIVDGRVGTFDGPRELLDWWEREGRAKYGKVPE